MIRSQRTFLLIVLTAVSVSAQAPESMRLVQVDRTGATKTLGRLPPTTFAVRISPNGRQVVFDALAPGLDSRSRQSERTAPAGGWPLSHVVRRRDSGTVHRRYQRAADVLDGGRRQR